MVEKICFELGVTEIKDSLVIVNSNLSENDIKLFFEGNLLQEQSTPPRTFTVIGRQPPDLLLYKGVHVISARVRSLMNKRKFLSAQFLNTQVEHRSGINLPGYSILNPLHVIPAWDLLHTTWFTDEKEKAKYPVLNIKEIALLKNIVGNNDVFRLAEPRFSLFISEDLKTELVNSGCSVGCSFVPIKCY